MSATPRAGASQAGAASRIRRGAARPATRETRDPALLDELTQTLPAARALDGYALPSPGLGAARGPGAGREPGPDQGVRRLRPRARGWRIHRIRGADDPRRAAAPLPRPRLEPCTCRAGSRSCRSMECERCDRTEAEPRARSLAERAPRSPSTFPVKIDEDVVLEALQAGEARRMLLQLRRPASAARTSRAAPTVEAIC